MNRRDFFKTTAGAAAAAAVPTAIAQEKSDGLTANKKGYILQPYPDYEINVVCAKEQGYYMTLGRNDNKVVITSSVKYCSLATLKDEYGGIAHIIHDDSCYMLVLKERGETPEGELVFKPTQRWFSEAVAALKKLPDLTWPQTELEAIEAYGQPWHPKT